MRETFEFVNSLVITKIDTSIRNHPTPFVGFIQSKLEAYLDNDSWKLEMLPPQHEKDKDADDTVAFLTCLDNRHHLTCIRELDGLLYGNKYIAVRPNSFSHVRYKDTFKVTRTYEHRIAVSKWITENYTDGNINRPSVRHLTSTAIHHQPHTPPLPPPIHQNTVSPSPYNRRRNTSSPPSTNNHSFQNRLDFNVRQRPSTPSSSTSPQPTQQQSAAKRKRYSDKIVDINGVAKIIDEQGQYHDYVEINDEPTVKEESTDTVVDTVNTNNDTVNTNNDTANNNTINNNNTVNNNTANTDTNNNHIIIRDNDKIKSLIEELNLKLAELNSIVANRKTSKDQAIQTSNSHENLQQQHH